MSIASMENPSHAPRRVVLVFQGSGALGAYQAGVYQALHEAGIEPAGFSPTPRPRRSSTTIRAAIR
jgi:predicted acylesterase/phospholipase RssA